MFANKQVFIPSPKPAKLNIVRDQHGVPHIQAANLNDLNWGMGYCFGLDRSTQLQMMRIVGQGRLCELLEDSDDNLKIDRFFRRMGWHQSDAKQLAKLDMPTRAWCQALCDGINAALSSSKLSPLRLLGYQAEPWRIEDIFLILRMGSYLTLAQSQAEVERLFIELAQSDISSEKLAELFPVDAEQLDRELLNKIELPERLIPSELLWKTAIPRAMASNNWVVSPHKSRSGKAMMANDPHLEVNRLPNVWYEMSLSCPEYQGLGYGMPGVPGLLVGRTANIAWGVTYTFMDSVDSWVEHCKNGRYRRGKAWRKFDCRTEVIKRKKHPNETVQFYHNAHGVLDGAPFNGQGEQEQDRYLLSTAWAPAHFGATSLNASYALTRAQSAKQAGDILGQVESAWNWVISDDQGNIAYQMSGLCPKRPENWNGFTPAPGWDKHFDWAGFEAPEDLPRAYNPECGYLVTANEDLNHLGKVKPINMPMGDYRSERIRTLLESQNAHDLNSFSAIQMDTYSLQAKHFLDILLPLLGDNDPLAALLRSWDGHYNEASLGAPLFECFYAALRQQIFGLQATGTDGFSEGAIEHLRQQSGLFIDFYQQFDRAMLNPNSAWFKEQSQTEAFRTAFERGKQDYQASGLSGKTWGELNTFSFTNILFQGKLPNWLGFDSDTYPMIGGRATPHQGQIYKSDGRQTSFAPSIRVIADLSEPVLHTRIAGGVSDKRWSPWYKSEIEGWLAGTYKKLKL